MTPSFPVYSCCWWENSVPISVLLLWFPLSWFCCRCIDIVPFFDMPFSLGYFVTTLKIISQLIQGILSWLVPHVEQEIPPPLWTHAFTPSFSGFRFTRSLVFCVMFCRSLFVLLSFFCWSLYCLFFFDIRLLISLISSLFSYLH